MQEQALQIWGRPDFRNTPWASLATQQGAQAACQQALQESGEEALARIGGDWALAWQRGDGSLLLAVDRFAVHPLCWRWDAGQLRFAPRADALADGQSPISRQAVYDYLFFHSIPAPRTIFEGVQRLPAAHCLLHRPGDALPQPRPYWRPHFEDAQHRPYAELREEFLSLVEQGVADQLGDTPLAACYLSGGTDSSTVAGMIRKIRGRGARAYSIGFEAQGYDEMAYARIAAQAFDAEHHEYYVTPEDLVAHIPLVAGHFDQPFGNSSVLPAHLCAQRARDEGVELLLAGDGGDELFGGNARYAKQRLFDWYGHVPGPLRRGMLEPLLMGTPLGRLPLARKAASYVEQAREPMPVRLNMYNMLLRLGSAEVLEPDFLASIDSSAPAALQNQVWALAQTGNDLNRALAFDWRFTLAESDLPKVIESARLAQVQVGFPFLSTGLLDFSLRLHPELKLKGQQLRWFFKESLRGFLPDAILSKTKHGFGLPFGVWAVSNPALRALAEDSLNTLAERDLVRRSFITSLLQQHLPAHPGYYGEMVWILMMLEQWLRRQAPSSRFSA